MPLDAGAAPRNVQPPRQSVNEHVYAFTDHAPYPTVATYNLNNADDKKRSLATIFRAIVSQPTNWTMEMHVINVKPQAADRALPVGATWPSFPHPRIAYRTRHIRVYVHGYNLCIARARPAAAVAHDHRGRPDRTARAPGPTHTGRHAGRHGTRHKT